MPKTKSTILPARLNQAQIPQVYAAKSAVYDIWGRLTESKAQSRCLELARIQDGEAVLEVAVGTGLTFQHILAQNPHGRNEGIDLTEAMLAKARQKAAASGTDQYRLQVGDAYHLDFAAASFDLLINNYMFDLLPESDFGRVLAEFYRVLKPGGRLVLVNMAQGWRWYNQIWDTIYRWQPAQMGGCRGVALRPFVESTGFTQIRREYISQMTFPSEVIYAVKPAV